MNKISNLNLILILIMNLQIIRKAIKVQDLQSEDGIRPIRISLNQHGSDIV